MSTPAPGEPHEWKHAFTIVPLDGIGPEGLAALAEAVEARVAPNGRTPDRPHPGPAEFDHVQVDSVARLIDSLHGCTDAVVSLPPLVVVKSGGRLRAHRFTPEEAADPALTPAVLHSPSDLIVLIDRLVAERALKEGPGRHRRP